MCIESLVEMIGPLSVHSSTCNRGELGISRARAGGGTGQKTALPGECIQDSLAIPVDRPNFQLN